MTQAKKQKIIVTGASGTLGRNFLDLVAGDDSLEIMTLLREGSQATLKGRHRSTRIDFNDKDQIVRAIDAFEPTSFVHMAATGMNFPKPAWFDLIRFNVGVSLNFCEAVARHPGCRFIFISTGLVYRDQPQPMHEAAPFDTLHPYGASKASADILIRAAAVEFGVPLTVLRPFSFTGPGDTGTRLFPSLLRAAAEGKHLGMSRGDQRRDHCSARDMATGILAAIRQDAAISIEPRIYNLGSGSLQPLRALVEDIVRQVNLNIELDFGARDYAPYEPMSMVADAARAQHDLGWKPRHNLAHAVWQLARESFASLTLREPQEFINA